MALWKGSPVLAWRDNHPREQDTGLGTLELLDKAEAHVHYRTWVSPFLYVRKEGVDDHWRYRVKAFPSQQHQGEQTARYPPVYLVHDRRCFWDQRIPHLDPAAFLLKHSLDGFTEGTSAGSLTNGFTAGDRTIQSIIRKCIRSPCLEYDELFEMRARRSGGISSLVGMRVVSSGGWKISPDSSSVRSIVRGAIIHSTNLNNESFFLTLSCSSLRHSSVGSPRL